MPPSFSTAATTPARRGEPHNTKRSSAGGIAKAAPPAPQAPTKATTRRSSTRAAPIPPPSAAMQRDPRSGRFFKTSSVAPGAGGGAPEPREGQLGPGAMMGGFGQSAMPPCFAPSSAPSYPCGHPGSRCF